MTTILLCAAALLIPVSPVATLALVGVAYLWNQFTLGPTDDWVASLMFVGAILGGITVFMGW